MPSIKDLDEITVKVFDRITNKDIVELNDDEKAFIKARRDYLSGDQKEKFAKILEEPKAKAKK